MMITMPGLAAEALGSYLAEDIRDRFGVSHARLAEIIPFAARLALECIGNSDALYHNVEHTMLVTLAGHDIFKGRALLTNSTPDDYSHFIVACLTHDIGYVRGILKGDGPDGYVIDAAGHKVTLPRGCSDAALAPYHVERSRLFVLDRLASIDELDGSRVANAISHTRFPYSSSPDDHDVHEDAALLRAADLIGQLGDPHYLRKALLSTSASFSCVLYSADILQGQKPLDAGNDCLWIIDYNTATHGRDGHGGVPGGRSERTKYGAQMDRLCANDAATARRRGRLRVGLYYPMPARLVWWEPEMTLADAAG